MMMMMYAFLNFPLIQMGIWIYKKYIVLLYVVLPFLLDFVFCLFLVHVLLVRWALLNLWVLFAILSYSFPYLLKQMKGAFWGEKKPPQSKDYSIFAFTSIWN